MKRLLKRAWKDTLSWFGGWSAIIPAILITPIGFALYYLQAPWSEVMAEWQSFLVFGLQSGGILFLGAFLYNFACAPYRIVKDKNIELLHQIEQHKITAPMANKALKGILSRRDSFTISEAASLLADNIPLKDGLSPVAQAQLQELKSMMRNGELRRIDEAGTMERLAAMMAMSSLNNTDDADIGPWDTAKISKQSLIKLSKNFKLPIKGLE